MQIQLEKDHHSKWPTSMGHHFAIIDILFY